MSAAVRARMKPRSFATCTCFICNRSQPRRAFAKRMRTRDVRHGERREIDEGME